MAKRTSIESEQPATGKEIRLPADATIKTFNAEFCEVQETVDEANERLKDAADIAKKKHLNVWAFKICQKLFDEVKNAKNEGLASEKLAIKLAQFDKIRKYFDLDKLAGLQGRLFGEGEIGGKPERKTDEDGEPDMRPDHLRQPGASVVADLASKTGAESSADAVQKIKDDALSKVGRGPQAPKLN